MIKIHNLLPLWLVVLACVCMSCINEAENSDRNYLLLDTLQFSANYKTALINAKVVGNPVMDDPSDTHNTKYKVFETSEIGDTLPAVTCPKIIGVRNVAREQMKKLDMKVLVVVDLTMEQSMVNDAKVAVQKMRRLFPKHNIYVSFMADSANISTSVPLSDSLLENDFVSASLDAPNKYLYRNLLSKWKECDSDTLLESRNKVLVLLSDGLVWGFDRPLDPNHFEIQQDLLDYATEQGKSIPVFFAGMSSDEALSPETNTTMQLVCARTGGICTQGFEVGEMYNALCQLHKLQPIDLRFELEYPDKREFWGEETNLIIQCLQGDSLVAYGKCDYQLGTMLDPIVINGVSINVFILIGFLLIALFMLLIYLVLQLLVPYVSYRLFKQKYVAPYTGPSMAIAGRLVATNCYFCKAPFQPGELVVGKCEHSMHKECWDENGYRCTEYGTHCQEGSHFYDSNHLFNPANAPYYMLWVLGALLAAVMAWGLFYLLPTDFKTSLLLFYSDFILDEDTLKRVTSHTFRLPSYGCYIAACLVGILSFLIRRRLPLIQQVRNILLRALVAGIGGYFCFFLDALVCTIFNIDRAHELVGLLTMALLTIWIVWVTSYHTEIRVKKLYVGIAYLVMIAGTIIVSKFYWGVYYDIRVLELISLVAYNEILAFAMAYDIKRSEHYFLRVEGAIKTIDIALYKWLRTSPSAVVTIGKSVNCNLQLSWDIEGDVAPLQAEVKMRNGYPCLFVHEEGVWRADETPMHVGEYLRLYHGTKFRIGNTTFTYIEKDRQ